MEILFQRKVKFATIKLLKNYSLISDAEKHTNKSDNIFLHHNIDFFNVTPKIKNRKTKYIHDTHYANIAMERASFKDKNVFVTEKDRHIKKHYGNPFAEITINNIERKIFIKDNRLVIDLFTHQSKREFNSIYFKNTKIKQTLILDLQSGNIKSIIINGNIKSFRINNFKHLAELITNTNLFRKEFHQFNSYENKIIENLYDDEIWEVLSNFFGCEITNVKYNIFNFIVNKFIELKNYKLPNNFNWKTVPLYYPTQKLINKNKKNITNAYLDKFGIKSKSTIRILNLYPDIEITYLTFLCRLFGRDYGKYLTHINFENFLRIESNLYEYDKKYLVMNPYMINKNYLQENDFNLSDVDKTNLIKLINHGFAEEKVKIQSHEIIRYLYDHFKILNKLRQYGIKINMKSKTINELTIEHGELSLMLSNLKKKYVQEFVFDEKLINEIENDCIIIADDNNIKHELFCYILKSELEYDEEGAYMHHCVASYVDNDNSLIISIRDKNTRDRVTCEFNNISGELLQAKYFCNQIPPEHFNDTIKNLTEKVKVLKKQKVLKYKTKKSILNKSFIIDENEEMFI